LAGEAAAAVGYSTQWAFSNATSGDLFSRVGASVLSGRLCCMRSTGGAGWWLCRPVRFCWAWLGRTSTSCFLVSRLTFRVVRLHRRWNDCSIACAACPAISSFPSHLLRRLGGQAQLCPSHGRARCEHGAGRPKAWTRRCGSVLLSHRARLEVLPGEFPFVDSRTICAVVA